MRRTPLRRKPRDEGPTGRGWLWAGVMDERFGPGKCAYCANCGDPSWVGERDINGTVMLAHAHVAIDPCVINDCGATGYWTEVDFNTFAYLCTYHRHALGHREPRIDEALMGTAYGPVR